jgi:hypothetical protein
LYLNGLFLPWRFPTKILHAIPVLHMNAKLSPNPPILI